MTTSFYFWTLTQEKQKCVLPIDSSMNVGSNVILNGTTLEEARRMDNQIVVFFT